MPELVGSALNWAITLTAGSGFLLFGYDQGEFFLFFRVPILSCNANVFSLNLWQGLCQACEYLSRIL
jgi:hypothetical protein